jgi:2-polyprenyl-3-methyl-5-hydroxy-6-metoxy-1,4-benzoquinol methylase
VVSLVIIAVTIILHVTDTTDLAEFYEREYSHDPAAERNSRWRALGAIGKAEHVIALCAGTGAGGHGDGSAGVGRGAGAEADAGAGGRGGLWPRSTLDVGCGDGALLCELRRRGFGGRLTGVEIAPAAVEIARRRCERGAIDAVELYDGEHLRARAGEYELGILSHVLEHVRQPAVLLAEVARACRAVVVEVPLEDNLSARRAVKREHAEEVGHLQRLSRAATRAIVARAGLRVAGELEDPLPLAVHRFLAGPSTYPALADARGGAKWALRAGLHRAAPGAARRLFTVHYACLCLPDG